jgi:CBS domain-containing protein
MKARDIMTTNVVSVRPDTPVRELATQLLERRISAVPVVDSDGRVVGIVSEGDLMRRQETGTERQSSWWLRLFGYSDELAQEYLKSHGRTAADVMTRHVLSVTEDAEVAHIADLLESRHIKRVPVVRQDRLVGIVSRADLVRALIAAPPPPTAPPGDDRKLYEAVISRLRSEPWADLLHLNIVVQNGEVQLWGIANSEEEREALRVLVESVPGVRAVHDGVRVMPRHFLGY